MKKLVSMLLALTMLLGIPAVFHASAESDLEAVTLKFYFFGDKKAETNTVWNAIADKCRDQLNVDFDVQFIAGDDYKQKMLVKIAAGDVWDLNFDGNWVSYYQMAALEAYMDLTDLLPVYAPDLYAAYQESGALDAAMYNGKLIALPWTMTMNNRPHFQWRGDLAEAAGIEIPENVGTYEDVESILYQLHEAYPDRYLTTDPWLEGFLLKYNLADISNSLVFDLSDPDCTVYPLEQTEAYMDYAKTAEKWQKDGIIWKDVLNDTTDRNALLDQGKIITKFGTHEFCYQDRAWVEEGAYWSFSDLYTDKLFANRTPLANIVCIPETSENPERTLMFLNMVETDQELYDLLHYGILGLTYNLDGEAAVFPEGMNAASSNYMEWGGRWAFWKPQYMRPDASYDEGFWEREAEYARSLDTNVVSPLAGFALDATDVNIETAQRDQIHTDMNKIISAGLAGDAETAVNNFIDQQKAAGVDIVVAEAQAQINAYLGK